MWNPPTLQSERLTLRPLQTSDKNDIFEYAQIPEITKFLSWEPHKTIDDSFNYITTFAQENYKNGLIEPLGVILKESNKLVGCVGCFRKNSKSNIMEMAYVLNPKFWGKGIMPEACQLLLDYCFKFFGPGRIQVKLVAENDPSARVADKLGMSFEGTLRSSLYHRNQFWDMKVYSIIESEWRQKQKSPFVRRAFHGDEEGIHKAHMRSIRELCSPDYEPHQIEAWGGREFNFESKRGLIDNQFVWVVEDQGKIHGYGLLVLNDEKKEAEVGGLYFTPEVCGNGLGKEIVGYMREVALLHKKLEILLDATFTAKSFYESCGFVSNGVDNESEINGVMVGSHPMIMKL